MDKYLCFLGLLVLTGVCYGSEFDCETLMPLRADTIPQERFTYPVTFKVSKYTYNPSDEIQVVFTIRDSVDIQSFAAQVRLANSDAIRGTWMTDEDSLARTHGCAREADTLVNLGTETVRKLVATWVAPHVRSARGDEEVELMITVMTIDGRFWTTEQPMLLREAVLDVHEDPKEWEEPAVNPADEEEEQRDNDEVQQPIFVENPNQPELIAERERQEAAERDLRGEMAEDHGLRKEIELIKLKEEQLANEIADEDRASEGDWSRVLEEERKAAEEAAKREMYQYEKTKSEEEEARRERMRMEIRDKEEWEREQASMETKKPSVDCGINDINCKPIDGDKVTDGASVMTATLVTVFLTFLAYFL